MADDVVGAVRDVDVACVVGRNGCRVVKLGRGGRLVVATVVPRSVAGDRLDLVGGGNDLADGVVEAVDDEQVSGRVQRDGGGVAQIRVSRQPAVAAVTPVPGPRDGVDILRGRIDIANDIVAGVGDEQIAAVINRDTHGGVELALVAA